MDGTVSTRWRHPGGLLVQAEDDADRRLSCSTAAAFPIRTSRWTVNKSLPRDARLAVWARPSYKGVGRHRYQDHGDFMGIRSNSWARRRRQNPHRRRGFSATVVAGPAPVKHPVMTCLAQTRVQGAPVADRTSGTAGRSLPSHPAASHSKGLDGRRRRRGLANSTIAGEGRGPWEGLATTSSRMRRLREDVPKAKS